MKFKKAVCVDRTGIDEFVMDKMLECSEELVIYQDFPADEAQIMERIKEADGVFVSWNTKITGEILEKCPCLKYVGMCCSLYDEASANVDIAAARKLGIEVKGVRDYGDDGVVEYIISELINLLLGSRGLYFGNESMELKTVSLGIVGLGAVGKRLAKAAEFFGMHISYHNRKPVDTCYPYVSLRQLLEENDVISLHMPRNTVVLGKEEFEWMGNHKILVSSGLGLPFDEDAFEKWICQPGNYCIMDAGSVNDCFRERFLGYKNIMINEKVSGFTLNARERLAHKVMDNVDAFLKKE